MFSPTRFTRFPYVIVDEIQVFVGMTSHCANPECSIPLRDLNHGRLFQFEIRPASQRIGTGTDHNLRSLSQSIARTIAHFWLCGQCSSNLTLVFDALQGVKVSPR
jgi:hypothetical protein